MKRRRFRRNLRPASAMAAWAAVPAPARAVGSAWPGPARGWLSWADLTAQMSRRQRAARGCVTGDPERLFCPLQHPGSVAQLDRALASGARGRAFESRRAHRAYMLPRHHLLMCGAILLLCRRAATLAAFLLGSPIGRRALFGVARDGWRAGVDHEDKDQSHRRLACWRGGCNGRVRQRQAGNAEGGTGGGCEPTAPFRPRNPLAVVGARRRPETVSPAISTSWSSGAPCGSA